jgi:ATP-dependent 26S proteasome regulatory subunit
MLNPQRERKETKMSDDPLRLPQIVYHLTAVGERAPSMDQKVQLAQDLRAQLRGSARRLDEFLLREIEALHKAILEVKTNQEELRALHEKLTALPWHLGLFLRIAQTTIGPKAIIAHGGNCRVVGIADEVDWESLSPGEEIFLTDDLNLIMEKSPFGIPRYGETGYFERYTDDGRMVLTCRDEEVILEISGALRDVEILPGDEVRYDRSTWMAFEKIARADGSQFLLTDVPDMGRDQVGGQKKNMDKLLSVLLGILADPARAAQYGLSGRTAILMVGPPGCGKTLMARVAASEVTKHSGLACRFGVVRPGEWTSPWVGTTEANIRNCFKALREAAMEGPCILFLDEIEAVGTIRGTFGGHHSDKFLATLLAELDGFHDRGNVGIVAASNRKDLLDPALLERLSDTEIRVDRPDLQAARSIFEIHLPADLPYSPNGSRDQAEATRYEIIETAVSRLYSPNGDGALSALRFRDGKTRTVFARELASGRILKQVCMAAREAAFLRALTGGDPGVCRGDMETALSNTMDRLRTTLTPRNVHAHLHDLPQDLDVVSVEPIASKVKEKTTYLMFDVV